MKQGKKLTRSQKECVSNNYLNATEWMLLDETEAFLKIIHKTTGKIKMVTKFPKKVR